MDVNIFLFDGFETLDAFGPVEILGKIDDYTLKYYSINGGVIASAQGTQIITEKVEYTSKDGILVIPGGKGTRTLVNDSLFIQALKETIEISSYCLSICTGSALVAKTGLLDNKKSHF